MKKYLRLMACGLLWLAAVAGATAPQPSTGTPLAQSAQLTVHATFDEEWLILRVQRTGNPTPIGPKDVSVSVNGHAMPVKARSDGTYVLPVKQLGTTNTPTLDVVVAHDGIREILSGQVTLPQAAPAPQKHGGHTQIFWWGMNIAIIFAVVMYFSNRKKPEAVE